MQSYGWKCKVITERSVANDFRARFTSRDKDPEKTFTWKCLHVCVWWIYNLNERVVCVYWPPSVAASHFCWYRTQHVRSRLVFLCPCIFILSWGPETHKPLHDSPTHPHTHPCEHTHTYQRGLLTSQAPESAVGCVMSQLLFTCQLTSTRCQTRDQTPSERPAALGDGNRPLLPVCDLKQSNIKEPSCPFVKSIPGQPTLTPCLVWSTWWAVSNSRQAQLCFVANRSKFYLPLTCS